MAEFVIRKATMMDIDTIMAVFECARFHGIARQRRTVGGLSAPGAG